MLDSIRWFKSQAKALTNALHVQDPSAVRRARDVWPDAWPLGLQRVQHVVAIEAGFESWGALLAASEVHRQLIIALEEHPQLNDFGIGLYQSHRRESEEARVRRLSEDRGVLLRSVSDVAWCVGWLQANVQPIRTINHRANSYSLKHLAERDSPRGYITNGVFIAAALILRYPCRVDRRTPNPTFGMSSRSISRLRTKAQTDRRK